MAALKSRRYTLAQGNRRLVVVDNFGKAINPTRKLPGVRTAAFVQLRQRLETELGPRTGTRHYIRVLQLLGGYSAEEVARVIEANLNQPGLRREFIEQRLIKQQKRIDDQNPAETVSPPSATFHLSEL